MAAMVRWPGKIPAGCVIDEPLWSPDILVACAKLARVGLPREIVFDGKDPLPTLCQNKASPHRSLFFEYRNHAALRMGNWKIVREASSKPWQLFNLKRDVSESTCSAACAEAMAAARSGE